MKAIVVSHPGDVDVMTMQDVPDPVPAARDVVIKVDSCGVCSHDVATRNGIFRSGVVMPVILGHEIAGIVVEVGKGVRGFAIGDRVATVQRSHICGCCAHCRTGYETLCEERLFMGDVGLKGGYAQYVAVEDDNVAIVPDGVPLAEAAITACAFGTVYGAISEVAKVKAGERVLVTGAGGGLGLHAVQYAKLIGAVVLAQTTSELKADLLRQMGADEVVHRPRGEDFVPAVRDLTKGAGVDVVIDTVGTPVFPSVRRSLAVRGRWILVGQLTGDFVPFNPAQLFLKNISMLSATSTTRAQLIECLDLVASGRVRPVVGKSLPLAQAALGHKLVESGEVSGRLVLKPWQTEAAA